MTKNNLSLVYSEADTLYPVAPDDLRGVWPDIRAAVQGIADKCEENWLPEDVFHELITGNASLWATPDRTGFAVLRLFSTAYSRDLFIWVAAIGDRPEGCAHYMPQFLEIARDNGCKRVTWESPRPYEKLFKHARTTTQYALDVES